MASRPSMPAAHAVMAQMDQARRQAGRLLDTLGAGPRPGRSRVLTTSPGFRLLAYDSVAATGPAVLMVPAPIKRWYIWDLQPDASVVARCLEHGVTDLRCRMDRSRPG